MEEYCQPFKKVGFAELMLGSLWYKASCRNGVVRFESVMKLREQLDQLGKMQGIKQDEKGI